MFICLGLGTQLIEGEIQLIDGGIQLVDGGIQLVDGESINICNTTNPTNHKFVKLQNIFINKLNKQTNSKPNNPFP